DMVPTRTGFTFGGFRQTNNQNTFTVTTNVTTSTVSLEAIWTSTDQVNLIFNPNGGNFPGQTGSRTFRIGRGQHISGYFGQTIDQLAGIPTRSGYTFAGWYVGNTNTAFTVTTSIDVNTTVNARWTANDLPGWTAPPTPTPPVSPPPTLPTTFNDVHQGQWYFNYVNTVSSLGIFQGTGNNQFSPNVNMTRAMFTQALANLHNANTAGLGTTFSDVGNNVWYTGPITWAFNSGIVQGTGDGRFNPNANITREQIALMLFNYANFAGVTLPTTGWTGNFNDANQISPWASIAVEALHAAGVITGRPGGTFDPQAQATRAEVAAMFARFAQFR
ncbi:MAG: S-layer homology domain-containing protein, partial [Defluviitaleaceae bacterium]|nr:S-layer homology domain-containing protein [Defluviitaleaceae bacterium]